MNIMTTLKIVILSTVGLMALTLLTATKPVKMTKGEVNIKHLPKTVELIGYDEQKFNTNSIIKKDTIIFVGNSQSIIVANPLQKALNLPAGKFVIVSNVSDEPWFIKRWQAHTKNEKLKGTKHIPWIYDANGHIRNFLQVPTADPLKYFLYKVNKKGIIKRIYIGKVTKEKKEDNITYDLKEVLIKLKKYNL